MRVVKRLAVIVSKHDSHAKGRIKMAGTHGGSHWASFARFRLTWIREADRIMKDCGEWTVVDVNGDDKSRRLWHRSARLYERAADFYRRAGLGIMGMVAWEKAAACYAALDMHEDAKRCTHKADTIPVFWTEEEPPLSENQGGRS
jgi:hypothetical protein